jgi:PAS domain S-box-containing protein
LKEAEETLQAIRHGAVDAFVIHKPEGEEVYTLQGADLPYSVLVEKMQQGAAMLNERGEIIYANPCLGQLVGMARAGLIGQPLVNFIVTSSKHSLHRQLQQAEVESPESEMQLLRADGSLLPVKVSCRLLTADKSTIGVLIRDLTAKKQLADLAARLQQVQDEERRRLARELHDSVGQLLVAIALNIAVIQQEAQKLSPEAAYLLTQNAGMVDEINDQIRTISHLLHPPLLDEVGLPSALRWYIQGFAERSKIETTLEIVDDFERLPRETEIAVFRTVQECLTNVHRHSGSSSCSVKVTRRDRQLHVEIRDEGRGIRKRRLLNLMSSGGVGLRGLQERLRLLGGSLEIHSDGKGTVVTAVLPIHPPGTVSPGQQVA